jgi:hypothetical protein
LSAWSIIKIGADILPCGSYTCVNKRATDENPELQMMIDASTWYYVVMVGPTEGEGRGAGSSPSPVPTNEKRLDEI